MTKYLKTADSEWYRHRLAGAMLCAVAAFSILFFRVFHLQVIQGEQMRKLSERNSIRLQSIDPSRGLIFDRAGRLLADNRPSFDVSIILKDAKPVEETVTRLAGYMKVPRKELMEKIRSQKGRPSYKPIVLKRDIGRETLAAIEVHRYDLPGIEINVKPRRHYISHQSAAHLLGYLGEISAEELNCGRFPGCRVGDYIGKFGIEKTYESYLRGERGGRQVEVNAKGQVARVIDTVPARPGHNIYLTIDQSLQLRTEQLLKGKAGAAVAVEPRTGQILAMTSSPSFDQNAFVSGLSHDQWEALVSNPFRPMENKAVQGEYPPASTYKIITAMAGLEEGVIDENTVVFCPGSYKFGGRTYRCWKKQGHGSMNVVDALAESCDVFFYQVGQKLGVDRLARYARACGLGKSTGVNLDNEASGLIPTSAWKKKKIGVAWQAGETLSVAIGQGYNLTTPIQMARFIAAVGGDGTLYRPVTLGSIETAEGDVLRKSRSEVVSRIPAGPETMRLIRKGLWNGVNTPKGTAWRVRLKGFEFCGKTGTAQIVGRKEDEEDETPEPTSAHLRDHAWFVAYAPSENPKIAVAVIVEHGEHGSSAAAHIAREMIRTYLEGDGAVSAEPSNPGTENRPDV